MSCVSELGTHDGLESLNFVSFSGHDQIEQGLRSSSEGQRQCIAESAVVLGHNKIRREQHGRDIEVDEMTSGRRYRIGCCPLHVLLLRECRIRRPGPWVNKGCFGLRSQLSVSLRSAPARVGIRQTTSLTRVQIAVRILGAKSHFSDIVFFS